jgi:tetratricopeptide (TPR) repeat protein
MTVQQALQAGLEHYEAGRLPEAQRSYQRALQLDPGQPDALHMLGIIALQLGEHELSLQMIARAIRGRPSDPHFLNNFGVVNLGLNRLEEALEGFERALAIEPDFCDALRNRGNALQALGRHDEALASYDRALAIRPDYAEALNNRGLVLHEFGRYEEALASYGKALTINPRSAEALSNRGTALEQLKRYDEALASHDQALAIQPEAPEVLANRSDILRVLDRCDEALASSEKALKVRPGFAEALVSRGNALQALGRCDEALASYQQALAVKPGDAGAHWNAAVCRLLLGDFARGWREYEWRWESRDLRAARRNFSPPLWLGKEDISGKSVLLHAEQGLGDTIQFARYAQAVAGKGARVFLEVQPALGSLLSDVSGAYKVLRRGDPLPGFDFHCPLMSAPLAFDTRLETIPADGPYLRAKDAAVQRWENILGRKSAPRIGIAWSGSPAHRNDRNRSMALSRLMPLKSLGATLVSLQNEARAGDENMLQGDWQILHFGPQLGNFSDTAALVSLLDLVISVDTAVAHLAGALGTPVWILLPFAPDWRWLLHREDSPWYPTARLYRQPRAGDWDSVLGRVKRDLASYLAGRG